ncbi:hypothetical protein SBRCBS47491_005601 [Sporothrix bragantina]|uniref:Uncharacterized protein n=1 Tax=Sporothrix bragantina TaxID=671064 RepID=A0ABP0BY31_9PEZI
MRFLSLVVMLAGAGVDVIVGADARVAVHSRDVEGNEHCPHDNLLRCLIGSPTLAYTFCSWSVGIYATPVTIYDTVTVPATEATSAGPLPTTVGQSTTLAHTSVSPETVTATTASSAIVSVSTVTVTQVVTMDHTQTTTATVVQTVNVVVTAPLPSSYGTTTISSSANIANRAVHTPRTKPKTSLACLDDLQPALEDISSACSCFASSQPTPTSTSTVTWVDGSPYCPTGLFGRQKQPTFPNCFADFHPYNCGTDHAGQVACSCSLTAEGTAQCTLGDFERDNACTTSDDCAAGWYCTNIECFGEDVSSVCTKACPMLFSGHGNDNNGTDDGGESDNDSAMPAGHPRLAILEESLGSSRNINRNLSVIIVNNDANGFGSGRARGASRSGHNQA